MAFFFILSLRQRVMCENHIRQFSDVFSLPAFVSAVDKTIFFDRSRLKLEKGTLSDDCAGRHLIASIERQKLRFSHFLE